jgi:hypothetical protein
MRATLSASLLAVLAAASISACSSSSNATNASADQAAATSSADNGATTNNAAASDNAVASAAPADASAAGALPVYPGATAGTRPKGVADGAPPQAKAYSTSDDEPKVAAWYKAHLKGAGDLGGNGAVKDVYLVGSAASGTIIMLVTSGGKTWIVMGPATK